MLAGIDAENRHRAEYACLESKIDQIFRGQGFTTGTLAQREAQTFESNVATIDDLSIASGRYV